MTSPPMPERKTGIVSRRSLLGSALSVASGAVAMGVARPLSGMTGASTDELAELGAREAVRRIRDGDMTAESYFARLIAQCRAHASLNGIASLDEGRMLETARAVDKARLRGERLGPAAGLPVAVKDQIAVAGYPAASGNPALKNYRPARDAHVVAKLVSAGAIAFAKTTCPNMTGNSSLTAQEDSYSPAYGVVRNPYDPVRQAGGSSGGSGVVLAARMVPAALGEDTNGSIRVPASFCGVVGLRPSTYTIENALSGGRRKRYSDDGHVISAGRLDTIGPMARTVADVAFLDKLITGERAPAVRLDKARIAIPRADYWDQAWLEPAVGHVARDAFAKLRRAGATLIEIDYLALRSSVGYLGGFSAMAMAAQLLNDDAPIPDVARWLAENMPDVTVEQFNGIPASNKPRDFGKFPALSVADQKRLLVESASTYREIFRAHGVLAIAAPSVPILPQIFTPSGATDFETVEIRGRTLDRGSVIITQTAIAPRYGAPSLSLPMGFVAGIPVGLGLDGLPGSDSHVLGLGIAVEEALGPVPPPPLG